MTVEKIGIVETERLQNDMGSGQVSNMLKMLHTLILVVALGVVDGLSTSTIKKTVESRRRFVSQVGISAASFVVAIEANALNPMTDTGKKRSGVDYDAPPAYLSEPTEEFKKAEAERAAFRKKQAEYRKVWDTSFANFQAAATDQTKLIAALSDLSKLVARNGGLPSGLKLTDMITLCRRVKAKASDQGIWDTQVEMEYMTLVRTVKRAQNPNLTTEDSGYL